MNIPPRPRIALGLALALAAGCDQPRPKVEPRPILNRRTQDIRDVKAETKPEAGGVVVRPKIVSKDPITLPGNAYVTMIGKISMDQIDYAIKLYQAQTGEYPKTYDEFMEKIIKENNIALPEQPSYRKYGYDAAEHRLTIIEYPALKAGAANPR